MNPPVPNHPSAAPRRGFTLVELLMVIIVVGILAGLILAAVGPARTAARNAKISTMMSQLNIALENFKQKNGTYPVTCGGTVNPLENFGAPPSPEARRAVFLRTLRSMFPRFSAPGAWDDGSDPTWDDANTYSDLQDYVGAATRCDAFPTGLQLNNLDAAESLVFWLGGIPHVTNTPGQPYTCEMTRFALDPSNPFQRELQDDPTPQTPLFTSRRTDRMFEFGGLKLVDSDGDGWPEAVPDVGDVENTPPLVYFDAGSLASSPFYPPATAAGLARVEQWGIAQPYADSYVAATGLVRYANEGKYQIIFAGQDTKFDDSNEIVQNVMANFEEIVQTRIKLYKKGTYFKLGANSTTTMGGAEADNITNFFEKPLGAAVETP